MYAAPPSITSSIFAKLPEPGPPPRESETASYLKHYVGCGPFHSILEGPAFDREGDLYFSDIAYGRIFRAHRDGVVELFLDYEGEPSGIQIHRDGRIFVCDKRKGIMVVDPVSRAITPLIERFELEPFRGASDLVFGPRGALYFTDQGMSDLSRPTGRLFRMEEDGRVELLLEGLASPNGVSVNPAGDAVCVALTRANQIIRIPIMPDGRISRVQNFIQLSGGGGPDGLAMGANGEIALAHPQTGVWIFDGAGEPLLRIRLCEGRLCTNIAFGGPDGKRLYITEAQTGTIQVADTPVRGAKMFSHT